MGIPGGGPRKESVHGVNDRFDDKTLHSSLTFWQAQGCKTLFSF